MRSLRPPSLLFVRAEAEGRSPRAPAAVEMDILPLVVALVPHTAFLRLVCVGLAMPAKRPNVKKFPQQARQCVSTIKGDSGSCLSDTRFQKRPW